MYNTIAQLNDYFRLTFYGGKVTMTRGVASLREHERNELIEAVQSFHSFSPDNDPYGEHDFGSVESNGDKFFWKIDYYNRDMSAGSEDAADEFQTTRVLTIMRAEEY